MNNLPSSFGSSFLFGFLPVSDIRQPAPQTGIRVHLRRLRAVSFFSVVRRAKRETRNGHARDWWRETGEARNVTRLGLPPSFRAWRKRETVRSLAFATQACLFLRKRYSTKNRLKITGRDCTFMQRTGYFSNVAELLLFVNVHVSRRNPPGNWVILTFSWQWTLYQNNLKNIALFFTFFKG